MAESKYGRLFTEADVARIIAQATLTTLTGQTPTLESVVGYFDEADPYHALTFPADEPLFLLRGQDAAAPDAINTPGGSLDYLTSCDQKGASSSHIAAALRAANRMHDWQEENPERVWVPT